MRSKDEILATLDKDGTFEGLQFMPEMQKYCGKTFRIFRRVDKLIVESTGQRRSIKNTVILEGTTCDGEAHDKCQRTCPLLWKIAWLKKVSS